MRHAPLLILTGLYVSVSCGSEKLGSLAAQRTGELEGAGSAPGSAIPGLGSAPEGAAAASASAPPATNGGAESPDPAPATGGGTGGADPSPPSPGLGGGAGTPPDVPMPDTSSGGADAAGGAGAAPPVMTPTPEPPTLDCNDELTNGTETDTDCGGACPACPDAFSCQINADCQSDLCDGETSACISCDDGQTNGDETGVDCGGSRCPVCQDGAGCEDDDDCSSSQCDAPTSSCISCSDGEVNGDEADLDCGGDRCEPCALGATCGDSANCEAPAVCSNRVCSLCGNGSLDPAELCDDPQQPELCTDSCQFTCVTGCSCAPSEVSGSPTIYAFCPRFDPWSAAATACSSQGFELVRVDTQAELTFVHQQANAFNLNLYWFGASDLASEGNFVWTTGDPVSQTFWSPGEPNGATNENCVSSFGTSESWNDAHCDSSFNYVCERSD